MSAIITLDLGWGDSGKGSIVDFLCSVKPISYVVRYSGGHQCGHNVVTPNGKSHCFSQFGSGSFFNVPTVLDRDVLIDPIALMKEYSHLTNLGLSPSIKIHERCSITSAIHKIANRATRNSGTTCGKGIATTRITDLKGVKLNITDSFVVIVEKLREIRAIMEDYTQSVIDVSIYAEAKSLYEAKESLWWIREFEIFETYNFLRHAQDDIIFEASQGLMLNEYGFRPEESTWGNVSERNATELLDFLGIDYSILGIIRSYISRHGGELPYEKRDGHDRHNPYNHFQGEMNFYEWPKDLLMALVERVDSLAINCLDEYNILAKYPKLNDKLAISGFGETRNDKILRK